MLCVNELQSPASFGLSHSYMALFLDSRRICFARDIVFTFTEGTLQYPYGPLIQDDYLGP